MPGDGEPIELGNISARKDLGYARDYVEGMWSMLQYKYGDDFVMGTGELHTVSDFVEEAFRVVGINVHCKGSGVNEVGLSDSEELLVLVKVNSKFFGPLESDNYLADYSKAREKLGWEPKTGLRNFVNIMAKHDLSIMESQGH